MVVTMKNMAVEFTANAQAIARTNFFAMCPLVVEPEQTKWEGDMLLTTNGVLLANRQRLICSRKWWQLHRLSKEDVVSPSTFPEWSVDS